MRRKKLLVIIILILITFGLLAACQEEELSQEDLKTRQRILEEIKSELEKRPEYLLSKEELLDEADELESIVKYEYDNRGNLIKANTVNSEGELIEKEMYLYDDNGLKVKKVNIDLIKDQMVEEVYEYNDNLLEVYYEKSLNGEKIEWRETEYHNNYHKKKRIIKREEGQDDELYYDTRGNLKKRISKRGSITEEVEHHYDENGNNIGSERIQKDDKGEIVRERVVENEYDNKGRRVSYESKRNSLLLGQEIEGYTKRLKEYDEDGNKIKIIEKDQDGKIIEKSIYKYNKQNDKILSMVKDRDENIKSYREFNYEYNESGKKIKMLEVDMLKEKVRVEEHYKYDKEGNLIQEIKKNLRGNSLIKDYYEYDNSGNLVRIRDYDWEGNLWWNKRRYYEKFNEGG